MVSLLHRATIISIIVFIAEEICSWLSPWLAEKNRDAVCLWKGDSQEHISTTLSVSAAC